MNAYKDKYISQMSWKYLNKMLNKICLEKVLLYLKQKKN